MADHSVWWTLQSDGSWKGNSLTITPPHSARIAELEAEVGRLRGIVAAIDDGSHAAEPVAMEEGELKRPVDQVIDMLDKRLIVTPDRVRLRDALDKAEKPLAGRAGADAGLGRAINRPSQFGIGLWTR